LTPPPPLATLFSSTPASSRSRLPSPSPLSFTDLVPVYSLPALPILSSLLRFSPSLFCGGGAVCFVLGRRGRVTSARWAKDIYDGGGAGLIFHLRGRGAGLIFDLPEERAGLI